MNRKPSPRPRPIAAAIALAVLASLLAPTASALALPLDLPPVRVGPLSVDGGRVDVEAAGLRARVDLAPPEPAPAPAAAATPEDASEPSSQTDAAGAPAPARSMIGTLVGWIASHWLLVMVGVLAVAVLSALVGRRSAAKRAA